MRPLIALGLLTLAGCTTTSTLEHAAPARYAAPNVPVTVTSKPAAVLADTCGLTPDRLVGCSARWPGIRCDIYVRADLPPAQRREVINHERAHCAGWVHADD